MNIKFDNITSCDTLIQNKCYNFQWFITQWVRNYAYVLLYTYLLPNLIRTFCIVPYKEWLERLPTSLFPTFVEAPGPRASNKNPRACISCALPEACDGYTHEFQDEFNVQVFGRRGSIVRCVPYVRFSRSIWAGPASAYLQANDVESLGREM
jgi:hypothetical protein